MRCDNRSQDWYGRPVKMASRIAELAELNMVVGTLEAGRQPVTSAPSSLRVLTASRAQRNAVEYFVVVMTDSDRRRDRLGAAAERPSA